MTGRNVLNTIMYYQQFLRHLKINQVFINYEMHLNVTTTTKNSNQFYLLYPRLLFQLGIYGEVREAHARSL